MAAMKRLLIALPLLLVLSVLGGCMAVLGYEPTPSELEAIKRGEDPRANEGHGDERTAGESVGNDSQPREDKAIFEPDHSDGPGRGTVLRWIDAETLVIEAGGRRETVNVLNRGNDLEALMDAYTYGRDVELTYTTKDARGEVIYRDEQGRLLANIR